MRLTKITVMCALLTMTCLGGASALEILYPADGSYVNKSNYLLIKGGTDPQMDGMSIEINGVESDVIDLTGKEYRAAYADMLILEPIFDPGINNIVVKGYLGSEKMATARSVVFYNDQYDALPPADFKREVFHFPDREAPCAACHNMNPTAAELATNDPRSQPCASCHARMLTRPHVHGPAGVFDCTYCHDIESRPNKYQPREGDATICLECHEDKVDSFLKSKFVHGPVEADLCLVCHDAHATEQKAQLVLPAYELCISCHEKVTSEPHVTRGSSGKPHPLTGVINPVGDGEDLSCVSCHDPHSGASEAMFRWGLESRFTLCGKCHNK